MQRHAASIVFICKHTMFEKIDFTKLVRLKINGDGYTVTGRPVVLKNAPKVQLEYNRGGVISHENVEETAEAVGRAAEGCRNAVVITEGRTYEFRRTKKGAYLSHWYANDCKREAGGNDRPVKRVVKTDSPALYKLGLTTRDGAVKADKREKFRQINRFAEIVGDVTAGEKSLKILDFGCGKSYLDFVLRDYLEEAGIAADITGLDIRPDVVDSCERLRKELGYENMRFVCADAKDYPMDGADMVVALHACDTATDYALYHAVRARVKYIFSVPCCQHEVMASMTGDNLLTEYGLIKERTAALITDAVRAAVLESVGYRVQVLEYVDDEHSLKNVMLRCVRTGKEKKDAAGKAGELLQQFGARQTLYELVCGRIKI